MFAKCHSMTPNSRKLSPAREDKVDQLDSVSTNFSYNSYFLYFISSCTEFGLTPTDHAWNNVNCDATCMKFQFLVKRILFLFAYISFSLSLSLSLSPIVFIKWRFIIWISNWEILRCLWLIAAPMPVSRYPIMLLHLATLKSRWKWKNWRCEWRIVHLHFSNPKPMIPSLYYSVPPSASLCSLKALFSHLYLSSILLCEDQDVGWVENKKRKLLGILLILVALLENCLFCQDSWLLSCCSS